MPAIIGLILWILISYFAYQGRATIADVLLGAMLVVAIWVSSDIYREFRKYDGRKPNGKAEKKSGNDKG